MAWKVEREETQNIRYRRKVKLVSYSNSEDDSDIFEDCE